MPTKPKAVEFEAWAVLHDFNGMTLRPTGVKVAIRSGIGAMWCAISCRLFGADCRPVRVRVTVKPIEGGD